MKKETRKVIETKIGDKRKTFYSERAFEIARDHLGAVRIIVPPEIKLSSKLPPEITKPIELKKPAEVNEPAKEHPKEPNYVQTYSRNTKKWTVTDLSTGKVIMADVKKQLDIPVQKNE